MGAGTQFMIRWDSDDRICPLPIHGPGFRRGRLTPAGTAPPAGRSKSLASPLRCGELDGDALTDIDQPLGGSGIVHLVETWLSEVVDAVKAIGGG